MDWALLVWPVLFCIQWGCSGLVLPVLAVSPLFCAGLDVLDLDRLVCSDLCCPVQNLARLC